METRAAKQALDTGGSPSSLLEATSCYCRPSILETTRCFFLAFPTQQTQTPQGQHRSNEATGRSAPSLLHHLLSALGLCRMDCFIPCHSPATASLSCCCLTAPDGYCLTDEVPSLRLKTDTTHSLSAPSLSCWRSGSGSGSSVSSEF